MYNFKIRGVTVFLIILFFVGLCVLLYPVISNWFCVTEQKAVITQYVDAVGKLSKKDYDEMKNRADLYNKALLQKSNRYYLTQEEYSLYFSLLNVSGNGVMGYLEIPKINLRIPIYHGTEESVLQVAVGHIAGSSLPVGGKGTHCVLSGHRGLPSAKLFTDLDRMQQGDVFTITVLNQKLLYEVEQILVTKPEDISAMELIEGEDYCTLMTCTPYGINTHRLLVRGKRI